MTERPKVDDAMVLFEEAGLPALPDVDYAVALQSRYLEICRKLLTDEDYAEIKGKKARKRSGWAKLRRAFNIETWIDSEERIEVGDDWGYKFVVSAKLPIRRQEEADGLCMKSELEGSNIFPTEHNVRAKALTRAKNRATSDLLGAGTVSAEELETTASRPESKKKAEKKHWIYREKAQKAFWAFAKGTLKLTSDEIYEALNVKHVSDFQGTMKLAKGILEKYAQEKEGKGDDD